MLPKAQAIRYSERPSQLLDGPFSSFRRTRVVLVIFCIVALVGVWFQVHLSSSVAGSSFSCVEHFVSSGLAAATTSLVTTSTDSTAEEEASVTPTVQSFRRYHEWPDHLLPNPDARPRPRLYTTAFEQALVVERAYPWFVPKRICRSIPTSLFPSSSRTSIQRATEGTPEGPSWHCCAQTVALSLEQDATHLINTVDGMDLADVIFENAYTRRGLEFFGSQFQAAKLPPVQTVPCWQHGTIVHLDNSRAMLQELFTRYLPHSSVPIVLLTAETDGNSPQMYGDQLMGTNKNHTKLLAWYGQSPLMTLFPKSGSHVARGSSTNGISSNSDHQVAVDPVVERKFVAFPLGFSKQHDQTRYLQRYMELTNYTNPFTSEQMEDRWRNAAIWKNVKKALEESTNPSNRNDDRKKNATDTVVDNAFYDTVWIRFGLNPMSRKRRTPIFEHLCDRHDAAKRRDTISCHLDKVTPHASYQSMSQYLFAVSPPGAGWDCYRTYELLVMGVIPIVVARPHHGLFRNLPVVEISEHDMQTWTRKQFLEHLYDFVHRPEFVTTNYTDGWQRLFLEYWRRDALARAGRDKDIIHDPETGKEFYQAWKYTVHEGPMRP